MLRITAETESATVTLKLEGDLTGIWVGELLDAWRATAGNLNGRTLRIDLNGVARVDKAGEYLLALARCTCGAQLIGSGFVTADLVRSIARDWPIATQEINKEA
jgi:ABC-type transporter Mla MlaB component